MADDDRNREYRRQTNIALYLNASFLVEPLMMHRRRAVRADRQPGAGMVSRWNEVGVHPNQMDAQWRGFSVDRHNERRWHEPDDHYQHCSGRLINRHRALLVAGRHPDPVLAEADGAQPYPPVRD